MLKNLNNIITETKTFYNQNHQRMMSIFKLIKKLDLNKERHDISESYFNKKSITYESWDDINNKAGNYKESDILKIFNELLKNNHIKYFIHEPNGPQTFPDFRVWFNDSLNCTVNDNFSKYEQESYINNNYINLGNDFIDFEIKTHKNIKSKNDKNILIKISNVYTKNIKELINNDTILLNHLKSYNIYIGYILEDFKIDDNIIKNGTLKTVTINICPFIYNISKTSKKSGEVKLIKYDKQILKDDVYSGTYNKVPDLITNFINNHKNKRGD